MRGCNQLNERSRESGVGGGKARAIFKVQLAFIGWNSRQNYENTDKIYMKTINEQLEVGIKDEDI